MSLYRKLVSLAGILLGVAYGVSADPAFLCECRAERPGFESADGSKKFCDYGCSCQIFSDSHSVERKVFLKDLPTSAYSFEDWDRGSHICHGQYAWRPTLDSPNWKIEPRFSSFKISNAGSVLYGAGGVETSNGTFEHLTRSEEAPEIREALQAQFR